MSNIAHLAQNETMYKKDLALLYTLRYSVFNKETKMKTFKFKVIEYGLSAQTERVVEVKAKTAASAEKKIRQIQGNREWQTSLLGVC